MNNTNGCEAASNPVNLGRYKPTPSLNTLLKSNANEKGNVFCIKLVPSEEYWIRFL